MIRQGQTHETLEALSMLRYDPSRQISTGQQNFVPPFSQDAFESLHEGIGVDKRIREDRFAVTRSRPMAGRRAHPRDTGHRVARRGKPAAGRQRGAFFRVRYEDARSVLVRRTPVPKLHARRAAVVGGLPRRSDAALPADSGEAEPATGCQ